MDGGIVRDAWTEGKEADDQIVVVIYDNDEVSIEFDAGDVENMPDGVKGVLNKSEEFVEINGGTI